MWHLTASYLNKASTKPEIYEKYRAAHDQLLQFTSQKSVNNRVKREALLDLIYGDAFRRIIHYIHSFRLHFPSTIILIGKYDFTSAYIHFTLWGHSAAATSSIIDDIGLISLQLTFGGSLCPFLWCLIAETLTDLANNILNCSGWDVDNLHSPNHSKTHEPTTKDSSIPFGQVYPDDVHIPPLTSGKVDGYIDDLIHVVIHLGDNARRVATAVPLAMHVLGQPVDNNELITHKTCCPSENCRTRAKWPILRLSQVGRLTQETSKQG